MQRHVTWILILAACMVVGISAVMVMWFWPGTRPATADRSAAPALRPCTIRFEDVTRAAGIRFVHRQWRGQAKMLLDLLGPGVAWGDYNGDGWPDLFVTNGSAWGSNTNPALMPPSRLFRNNGDGTFTDVTDEAGVGNRGIGTGAVWGDYDNDGRLDLYVCNYRHGEVTNRLYHNNGDGSFTDVTAAAAAAGHRAAMGACWLDEDGDGFLDLYIPSLAEPRFMSSRAGFLKNQIGALAPKLHPPVPALLLHNNGDGTFTDIARQAGVLNLGGWGLQAVAADVNNDGRPDLFVGNDGSPNHLYVNRGDGTFEDASAKTYMADIRSSMGIAPGDYDHNGSMDFYCTHFLQETNALFRNNLIRPDGSRGTLGYNDMNEAAGLKRPSLAVVGWGTGFVDLDNDGWVDLFAVNGHTDLDLLFSRGRPNPEMVKGLGRPDEPTQLFRNLGDGTFDKVDSQAGPWFAGYYIGRGAASADYDRDGWIDLAVGTNNGPLYLLRNAGDHHAHWLSLHLIGRAGNRGAVGARVLVTAAGATQTLEVMAGGSYLSCHDAALHVGLGQAEAADQVTIRWPSGSVSLITALQGDQVLEITEPQPERR